ncbi:MAG: hypothetical protein ABSE71_00840 [Candidatus Micrarchaeaceae archaeon]|jgi:hypothetical protein|nr:hypothetical protein [Candidatus Micrarchaeota archaeon]HII10324.1 hypothetical protein [Candidatus Micrarchaeota archaeon]
MGRNNATKRAPVGQNGNPVDVLELEPITTLPIKGIADFIWEDAGTKLRKDFYYQFPELLRRAPNPDNHFILDFSEIRSKNYQAPFYVPSMWEARQMPDPTKGKALFYTHLYMFLRVAYNNNAKPTSLSSN